MVEKQAVSGELGGEESSDGRREGIVKAAFRSDVEAVNFECSTQVFVALPSIPVPIERFQLSNTTGNLQGGAIGVEGRNRAGSASASRTFELASDLAKTVVED